MKEDRVGKRTWKGPCKQDGNFKTKVKNANLKKRERETTFEGLVLLNMVDR